MINPNPFMRKAPIHCAVIDAVQCSMLYNSRQTFAGWPVRMPSGVEVSLPEGRSPYVIYFDVHQALQHARFLALTFTFIRVSD